MDESGARVGHDNRTDQSMKKVKFRQGEKGKGDSMVDQTMENTPYKEKLMVPLGDGGKMCINEIGLEGTKEVNESVVHDVP